MPKLPNTLHCWQTEEFASSLKAEIANLDSGTLPLDQGVNQGGYVDDRNVTIILLHCIEDIASIRAKVGVFFTEIIVSCGCGDEPMPTNAYCEMQVSIDKATSEAAFTPIAQ